MIFAVTILGVLMFYVLIHIIEFYVLIGVRKMKDKDTTRRFSLGTILQIAASIPPKQ